MKNIVAIALTLALYGCATGDGGVYGDIRRSALSEVAGYAKTVKLFLATGTPEQAVQDAKQALADGMKDPSSVQFRNVRLVNYLDGQVICGEVNAKNSYGGYVGFSPFVASSSAYHLYDNDKKHDLIASASNAGINVACTVVQGVAASQSVPALNEPGMFRWPAVGTILAGFNVSNKGIDISGNAGDPVYAADDGKVVFAGSLSGYGNLIIIKHASPYMTAYGNNQLLLVTSSQTIAKGQKIAEMGTGDSNLGKLRFEIRRNGTPVDPIPFLPSR